MKNFFDTIFKIVLFFAENQDKSYPASRIREKFNLPEGHNDYYTHNILTALVDAGYLTKEPNRKGFKYKTQNT